jgi:methyltransferase-like protein
VAQATPYGNALRSEATFLVNQRDDYVLHEFLEAENVPCTVTEFVLAAEKHGTSYLAETEVHTMLAETYGEDTAKALRELAGNRVLPLEQYIDILTGRTFRQTILVKTEQARRAQRMLEPVRLMDLHLSGKFRLEPERTDKGAFLDASDRTLTTASAAVATALEALAARYPATAQPRELIAIATRWTDQPALQEAAVLDALFRMANVGMIDFSTVPLRVGTAAAERPLASAFARLDAIENTAYTASLRHEAISIDVPMRALLPLLDGTRDRAGLIAGVIRIVAEGGLQLMRDGRPVEGEEARQKAAAEFVEATLKSLESNALLEPT